MTPNTELEQLTARIAALRTKVDKAAGTMEAIQAQWLKDYGTDDPTKIREILDKESAELEALQKQYDEGLDALRKLLNEAGAA